MKNTRYLMKDNDIKNYADKALNDYLNSYPEFKSLFNTSSMNNDSFKFFEENFDIIRNDIDKSIFAQDNLDTSEFWKYIEMLVKNKQRKPVLNKLLIVMLIQQIIDTGYDKQDMILKFDPEN